MGETLTLEEWEDEVKRIERANERARTVWARLTEPHKRFLPPDDTDRKTLMNLFARTSGALSKQINAVRQIAEQGGQSRQGVQRLPAGQGHRPAVALRLLPAPGFVPEKGRIEGFHAQLPGRHETRTLPPDVTIFRQARLSRHDAKNPCPQRVDGTAAAGHIHTVRRHLVGS
jgi:hypothetical protein